jgi:hypothetical protein
MIPVISAVAGAGFAIWRSRIDAEVRTLRELLSADVLDAAHAKRATSIISAAASINGGVRAVTGRWGNAASYEILCTLCRAPASSAVDAVDEFPAFYAAIASIRARLKCRFGESRYL